MNPSGIRKMRHSARAACGLLAVLAQENRLLLLCQLGEREHSVGELEERLGIRQPTLSQHLGVLRREGLVETRRDGKKIYYSLASKQAQAVIETLYTQFCVARPARAPFRPARDARVRRGLAAAPAARRPCPSA